MVHFAFVVRNAAELFAVIVEHCVVYNYGSTDKRGFYVWSKEGRYPEEVDGCS